jgi:hypothetical protein
MVTSIREEYIKSVLNGLIGVVDVHFLEPFYEAHKVGNVDDAATFADSIAAIFKAYHMIVTEISYEERK